MEVDLLDQNVDIFISSLEEVAYGKALRSIELLKLFGSELLFPHSKKITNNLFELRVRGKQEIRIFYTFNKNKAILLHGFIKKTQKIPRKEINIALMKLKFAKK